uniref:ENR1 protein n=1 Tax=Naja naja TaxID=35670 RepID=A0A8C7E2U7_NAJNA
MGYTVHPDTIPREQNRKWIYLIRVKTSNTCYQHTCNKVNITFPVPENWLGKGVSSYFWQKGFQDEYGFGIDGTGPDPGIVLKIQVLKHDLNPLSHSLFHSYYEEVRKVQEISLPPVAHNMFLSLAETIAKELMVTNCFVCGGTNMGEQWPWEAQEVNYTHVRANPQNFTFRRTGEEVWAVTTNLVGNICYHRNKTSGRTVNVGSLRCFGTWDNQTWWSGENNTKPEKELEKITEMFFLNDPEDNTFEWKAPDGLYWICGKFAYSKLRKGWYGSCVLGAIRPSFFLLPLKQRQVLGVPVYEEIGNVRDKRDTQNIHRGIWKDEDWPLERIIH